MSIYCISDIHGHWDNFKRFIDTLKNDDMVYVLGDVVDKGNDSIKCLQYIMKDNRFIMILGNHEYMMYQLLSQQKGSYEYLKAQIQWLGYNSGNDTYSQYIQLPDDEREEIFEFIRNLALNKPEVKVNDRVFYLVHSHRQCEREITMADVDFDDETICSYVWDRINVLQEREENDKIIISGHTPVQMYGLLNDDTVQPIFGESYIDIDGGLASRKETARLIALCLDNLSYATY